MTERAHHLDTVRFVTCKSADSVRTGDRRDQKPSRICTGLNTIICSMTEQTLRASLTLFAHAYADRPRLAVLRLLERRLNISQRELSAAKGLSLGRTHFVQHAVRDKGLVMAENLRRSDRKLTYAFVVNASGLRDKVQLTQAFLVRMEAQFEQLHLTTATLKGDVCEAGA